VKGSPLWSRVGRPEILIVDFQHISGLSLSEEYLHNSRYADRVAQLMQAVAKTLQRKRMGRAKLETVQLNLHKILWKITTPHYIQAWRAKRELTQERRRELEQIESTRADLLKRLNKYELGHSRAWPL